MNVHDALLSLPADLEVCLLLGYAIVVLAGARLMERLALHVINRQDRVAVYRAPVSACAGCEKKAHCTPRDEGRHIYRPLAAWTETDVGRFHQWLSLLTATSAAALSLAALLRWAGRPGTGLLIVVAFTAASVAVRDARLAYRSAGAAADDGIAN